MRCRCCEQRLRFSELPIGALERGEKARDRAGTNGYVLADFYAWRREVGGN